MKTPKKHIVFAAIIAAATAATAPFASLAETIDLAALTMPKGESVYMVNDGDVLTGTLNPKVNPINIVVDGVSVTLKDVTIVGRNNQNFKWGAITCRNNASITLEGQNTLVGFWEDYPAIHVEHQGAILEDPKNTLTIGGDGSLTASSNGDGAGIGGGKRVNCGSIVINGGTITANGGNYAAGIGGGGAAVCGDITINGGTVTANGGIRAAGIGCGNYMPMYNYKTKCGDITFSGNAYVRAKGGVDGAGIGSGLGGTSCGNISFGADVDVWAWRGSPDAEWIGAGVGSKSGAITIAEGLSDITQDDVRMIDTRTWDGDLALVNNDTDFIAINGMVLHGELTGINSKKNYARVMIADGATVTLRDVKIDGTKTADKTTYMNKYPGITCLGDATLILEGDNYVTSMSKYRNNHDLPAIYIPKDHTLVIKGDGKLKAEALNESTGIGGPFITEWQTGGNIVIEGGDITVYGEHGTGIGDVSNRSNSSITITGGKVEAYGNGSPAIGCRGDINILGGDITATSIYRSTAIGSGNYDHCGNINIGTEAGYPPVNIYADAGSSAAGIGTGIGGKCGIITIGTNIGRIVATRGSKSKDYIGAGADSDTYISHCEGVVVADGLVNVVNKKARPTSHVVASPWDGNLDNVDTDVTAKDGAVITGTLATKKHLYIPHGATVTLRDANVENLVKYSRSPTLECDGDATIILEGTNYVKSDDTGIYWPSNCTLVVKGDGVLNVKASSRAAIGANYYDACGDIIIEGGIINAESGSASGIGGHGYGGVCGDIWIKGGTINAIGQCGIGSGPDESCGTITIDGGNIVAASRYDGAGIGTAAGGKCGDIIINGGNITATGKRSGAGIGPGAIGKCGNITIGANVERVVATCGDDATNPIGANERSDGKTSKCGTITIDPMLMQSESEDGATLTITPFPQLSSSKALTPIDLSKASKWTGYLRSTEDGSVAGSVAIAISKMNSKSGTAKVTILVTLPGQSKKLRIKGTVDSSGVLTIDEGDTVTFGENGFGGSLDGYAIEGARSVSKTDLKGNYTLAWGDATNGWNVAVAKVKANGSATLGGWFANGKTFRVNGKVASGDEADGIAFVSTKKASPLSFNLWFTEDGVKVDGLGSRAVAAPVADLVAMPTTLSTDFLTEDIELSETGRQKLADFLHNAKISYNKNTGYFTGSFKIGKKTVRVRGYIVDGVGYGWAKLGKLIKSAILRKLDAE